MMMMTRKIVNSRVSGFSRAKLEAGRNGLGLCTAELEGVLYPDHVRFHSCHPYIERLPTL